jgi:glycerol-3-phosphate acyltransferase PlsY
MDIRAYGDGNPGAWNALKALGGRRAWPAFVGDGLKGLAAGLAGRALTGEMGGAYAGVAAAMIGHCFPVFLRFRGGKAVMTFGGGAFALSFWAAAIALAACGAVSVVRSFAWGARVGIFGFPIVQLAFVPPLQVAATGGLMTLIGLRFLVRPAAPRPDRPDRGEREPQRRGGVEQGREPEGRSPALVDPGGGGQQRQAHGEQDGVEPRPATGEQAGQRRGEREPDHEEVERLPGG